MKQLRAPTTERPIAPPFVQPAEAGGGEGNAFLCALQAGQVDGTASLPFLDTLEARFGTSFRDVGAVFGVGALEGVGVGAVTSGDTIAFAEAAPDLSTVAHELAHVVQNRRGSGGVGIGTPGGAAEREADAASRAAASGDGPIGISARPDGALQFVLTDVATFRQAMRSTYYDFDTGLPKFEDTHGLDKYVEDKADIDAISEALVPADAALESLYVLWESAFRDGCPTGEGSVSDVGRTALVHLGTLFQRLESLKDRGNSYGWGNDAVVRNFRAAVDELLEQVEAERARLDEQLPQYETWAEWVASRDPNAPFEAGFEEVVARTWTLGNDDAVDKRGDWAYDGSYASIPLDEQPAFTPGPDEHGALQADLAAAGLSFDLSPYGSQLPMSWLYAKKEGLALSGGQPGCRIYLDPHPSFIADVLSWLAPHLGVHASLEPPTKSHRLKIPDPADMGKRPEGVVLYVFGSDAQMSTSERERLLAVLADFQAQPLGERGERLAAAQLPATTGTCADLFLPRIPPTTQPAPGLRGVSHAPQPESGQSYGQSRIAPIQQAFYDNQYFGTGMAEYRMLVRQRALDEGIDPAAPWETGPTAPALARMPTD